MQSFDEVAEIDKGEVLEIHVAITNIDPGSKAMRFWYGPVGGGHSHIQIEGKAINHETQEEMLAFSDMRAGAGLTTLTGGDPEKLIKEDIDNVTKRLVDCLKK